MNPDQSRKQNKRSRLYFIIAAAFVEVWGLLWSVDPSFFYLLLGVSVIFIFLGLWNTPRARKNNTYESAKTFNTGKQHSNKNLFQTLRGIFGKSVSSPSHSYKKVRSYVLSIVFFIFPILFFVTISLLFSDDETYSYSAVEYYSKAENFRWNGEYDSADHYYRKALYEKPDYLEARVGYGYDWMAKERYDSAIAMFDKALDVEPGNKEARYGKALTYHYQKNYIKSLKETLTLMKDVPEYEEAVILTGDNYYMQQRYDSAIHWYETGYDRGQRSAWLCHVMAYIYDTKGDQEKATHLYQEALSYDSTRTDVYSRLGELFPGKDGEYYRDMARQLKEQGY